MDDRTFYLIVGILITTFVVVVLGGLAKFEIPAGFWAVPGGIIGLLTLNSQRKNGNGSSAEADEEAFYRKHGFYP